MRGFQTIDSLSLSLTFHRNREYYDKKYPSPILLRIFANAAAVRTRTSSLGWGSFNFVVEVEAEVLVTVAVIVGVPVFVLEPLFVGFVVFVVLRSFGILTVAPA